MQNGYTSNKMSALKNIMCLVPACIWAEVNGTATFRVYR